MEETRIIRNGGLVKGWKERKKKTNKQSKYIHKLCSRMDF